MPRPLGPPYPPSDPGVVLHGERAVLRPLAPADADRLRAILAEPAVARWWGPEPEGFPLADEPEVTRFTIVAGGQVAGLVQFGEEPEPQYRHAWVDLYVDPAVHGEGLGADALRTLFDHLVEARGHHRVTIDPALANVAAIRCYEKAGFRAVGVMERAWHAHETGEWSDTLLMERVVRP